MKSVVICGSRRFKPEIREFAKRLKRVGIVVFEPYLLLNPEDEWKAMSDEHKKFIILGLTHDHFYKIRMADVVLVYNKNGYCGNSTTLEIGYAVAAGKPLYALSADEELCRCVLFRGIVKSPKELIKYLK